MHLLLITIDNYSPPPALTSMQDWFHETISREVSLFCLLFSSVINFDTFCALVLYNEHTYLQTLTLNHLFLNCFTCCLLSVRNPLHITVNFSLEILFKCIVCDIDFSVSYLLTIPVSLGTLLSSFSACLKLFICEICNSKVNDDDDLVKSYIDLVVKCTSTVMA